MTQVEAAPALSVVVRGCPLGTGQDCCEWQANGTAGETTTLAPGGYGSQLAC
jgi:hypothetical protein